MDGRTVFIGFLLFLVLSVLIPGCATGNSREEVLARLLNDIEEPDRGLQPAPSADTPVSRGNYRGPDSPDRPVSGLPSLDMVNGHKAEDRGQRTGASGHRGSRTKRAAERDAAPVTIQPDSVVQIRVMEDATLDGSYPVNEIGAVDLGYVGPVILLNKTEEEAALKISEVLVAREFRKATVQVRIIRASYDKVKVSGAVAQQGLVRIGAGDSISLNDALIRAGGIKASAHGAKVRIIRDGLLSAVGHELQGEEYTLVDEGGKARVPDVMLNNNDVVRVFSSKVNADVTGGTKEILVVGEVSRPGMYRFMGDEPCTIMHLIFKMGGLPPYANRKEIVIKRTGEDGFEEDIEVNAENILKEGDPADDVPLENGDRVIVPARRLSLF